MDKFCENCRHGDHFHARSDEIERYGRAMTPETVKAIRAQAGLTQSGLARILRISDIRTIRRWEKGDVPITGPASIILELMDADELPNRFWT